MKGVVKKWGNSAAVRIPASVLQSVSLHIDAAVDVREDGGRIIIEPVRKPKYTLDELLDGMTKENIPELIDFGPPVGKEIR